VSSAAAARASLDGLTATCAKHRLLEYSHRKIDLESVYVQASAAKLATRIDLESGYVQASAAKLATSDTCRITQPAMLRICQGA
jgi:hypothetical protein